jgi:hypothetical protein
VKSRAAEVQSSAASPRRMIEMISVSRSIWIGLALGIVVGAPLFLLSFLTAFGICSDTTIAESSFPFALIGDPSLFARPLTALILALVQYPLYGITLGIIWAQGRVRKLVFVLCVVIMFAGHLAAVRFANHRVKAMWDYKFSQMAY